jgi:hypothetical protein
MGKQKHVGARQSGNLRRPLDFKITKFYRRHSFSTAVDRIATQSCGHPKPVVRNVTRPDGAASYLCRECYGYLCRVEFRAVIRAEFAKLFNLWPLVSRPGAALGVTYA